MALTTAGRRTFGSRVTVGRYPVLLSAAALMAVAAAIHVVVVPAHLAEWPLAAVFFIALAAAQASLAVLLVRRPQPITLLAGIWSNVGVVAVYVWSRTSGLPFAPLDHGSDHGPSQAGHAVGGHGNGVPIFPGTPVATRAEAVGALDLAALGVELAVIALLVYLLPIRHRQWTGNGILACGTAMLALRLTGVLT